MQEGRRAKLSHWMATHTPAVIFIIIFAVLGTALLIRSYAANSAVGSEAEDGSSSGITVITDSSASGGKAIKFGDIASASNPLPFDMPSTSTLRSSNKLVFAHYWPPMPLSIDNLDSSVDYYARNYLTVNGESGKHAAYGGYLRERPLPRAIINSTSANSATCPLPQPWGWRLDDMKTEVNRAISAGLDGFTLDLITPPGGGDYRNCQNGYLMLEAAHQVDPNFKIALMPDMSGSLGTMSTADFASYINDLNDYPAAYHLSDGRLVLAPFYPEKYHDAAWWSNLFSVLQSQYGINVAFVPCFLNYTANASSFASISYGFSNWGNGNPAANGNLAQNISDAHSRGKIWMQPVRVQDERPYAGIYDEANNTENLRVTWDAAIAGADWVQIPTWNDYSEEANISPSTHIGWSPLDIISYYLVRFKTGAFPTLKRDVLYVSNRSQPYAATPTGGQTKLMVLRGGSSPARDKVEILSFLPSPATVTVKIGSNTYTYTAPAGMNSQLYNLATGTISAKVTRGSTITAAVTSPITVTSSPVVQDLHYNFVSTSRDGNPGDY